MSGWPTPVEHDGKVRGQLGREWKALRATPAHVFPGKGVEVHRRVLLYITTGATLPKTTFEVVAKELHDKGGDADGFRSEAYWASWFTLAEIVRDALEARELARVERAALVRLLALLTIRKLVAFSGIEPPTVVPKIPWTYAPRPSTYPTRPTPRTVGWSYPTRLEATR